MLWATLMTRCLMAATGHDDQNENVGNGTDASWFAKLWQNDARQRHFGTLRSLDLFSIMLLRAKQISLLTFVYVSAPLASLHRRNLRFSRFR